MTGHRTVDFAAKPTLVGTSVTLRPFTETDLPGIAVMLADPEALRLTGSEHGDEPLDGGRSSVLDQRTRDWYGSRNAQTDRLDLAVVDRSTDRFVGEVVLNEWDEGNRSCGFRVIIGPAGRDRGLGTDAVRLIVGYGFEQLGLHRISLEVFATNPRARRVYEKVGFVAEGVLRESLRYGDEWIDTTVMAILADEWFRHRGRP